MWEARQDWANMIWTMTTYIPRRRGQWNNKHAISLVTVTWLGETLTSLISCSTRQSYINHCNLPSGNGRGGGQDGMLLSLSLQPGQSSWAHVTSKVIIRDYQTNTAYDPYYSSPQRLRESPAPYLWHLTMRSLKAHLMHAASSNGLSKIHYTDQCPSSTAITFSLWQVSVVITKGGGTRADVHCT